MCIEFSPEVTAKGGRGPVSAEASLKANTGASWVKTTTVNIQQVRQPERGCTYQPTRIYARLVCNGIRAKSGSFLANAWGEELVTTNSYCSPVQPHHKASGPSFGRIKQIADLGRLYDAFGKDIVTGRLATSWIQDKAFSVRLKAVVDPTDATLYVTEFSFGVAITGVRIPGESKRVLSPWVGPKLEDYRGLYGKKSAVNVDEVISYSPSNLVKVWEVAVRAK